MAFWQFAVSLPTEFLCSSSSLMDFLQSSGRDWTPMPPPAPEELCAFTKIYSPLHFLLSLQVGKLQYPPGSAKHTPCWLVSQLTIDNRLSPQNSVLRYFNFSHHTTQWTNSNNTFWEVVTLSGVCDCVLYSPDQ